MSNRPFYIALSHAILAGTSIYCWNLIKNENLIAPHVTYGLTSLNNIVGVLWWTTEYDSRLQNVYRFTSFCQLLFALPGITTTVWLGNGYHETWSWAWLVVPVVPLVGYLSNSDVDLQLAELLVLFNLVGLGFVSFIKDIKYGVGAAVGYAVAHAYIKQPVLYNFGLCFFAYCALRAIGYGRDLF